MFSPSFLKCKFGLHRLERDCFFIQLPKSTLGSHLHFNNEYEADLWHGRLAFCWDGGFTFGGFKGCSSHFAFSMQVGTMVSSTMVFSSSMLVCVITLTTFEHCNATELVKITFHNWSKLEWIQINQI